MRRSGFSLIELSVVLAIIGLLVGGVMAGRNILKASERRSVISEYQRYDTATQNFITKFNQIPGDMPIATSVWGDNATACSDSNTDSLPGTCNGNGDGNIGAASGASATGEMFQFWVQLGYAGFIGGKYTGLAGSGGASEVIFIGSTANSPAAKITGAGWSTGNLTTTSTSGNYYYVDGTGAYDNILQFGGALAGNTNQTAIITPEDAWSIDSKLDDGRPASGKILGAPYNGCGSPDSGSTTRSNTNASYVLSSQSPLCILVFRNVF